MNNDEFRNVMIKKQDQILEQIQAIVGIADVDEHIKNTNRESLSLIRLLALSVQWIDGAIQYLSISDVIKNESQKKRMDLGRSIMKESMKAINTVRSRLDKIEDAKKDEPVKKSEDNPVVQ